MGIISMASGNSCWRGLEYYKNNKVTNLKKINEKEYKSVVKGSSKYEVYLNLEHPRMSKCNCPLADGRRVICKHIVATYFASIPGSAKEFEDEQKRLEEEYEDNKQKEYENTLKYIDNMSKEDLIKNLKYVLNVAPDWVYEDFVRKHDIDL